MECVGGVRCDDLLQAQIRVRIDAIRHFTIIINVRRLDKWHPLKIESDR